MLGSLLWGLALLLICNDSVLGYMTEIRPNDKLCVWQKFGTDQKVECSYHVTKGRSLIIDVTAVSPSGETVANMARKGEGRFTIVTDSDAEYMFCFQNEHNSRKTVAFQFTSKPINDPQADPNAAAQSEDDGGSPFLADIKEIAERIDAVQTGQRFLIERDARLRNTIETTSKRVKLWTVAECLIVLGVSVFQLLFFRHIIEQKKSVAV